MAPKYDFDWEDADYYDPDDGYITDQEDESIIEDEFNDYDTYDWDERDGEGFYDPYNY